MNLNNMKEALNYATSKDAKSIIGKIKERRDRIQRAFTATHS